MLNSVVLDIFIGLVLIYLLYSLFITIIGEMIATWMAIRSRILRVAIEKMLNDGYHRRHLLQKNSFSTTWNFIQQYFLKEFDDFKYSFAGKFYNCPSIKYLSDKGGEVKTGISQTKPSYISAEMFADTLLQLLKEKGTGENDIDKINFCLRFNTHHIEPSTLKSLRDMAESAGNDINVLKVKFKAWYNETMDRANGWYKRKLQLLLFWLGFVVAAIFNVDSIQMAKKLSKDKDARNELVRMGTELSKDSVRYKDFMTGMDTLHPKAIVDSGYAHVTRDMQDANMAMGLGWGTDTLTSIMKFELNRKVDKDNFREVEPLMKSLKKKQQLVSYIYSKLQNTQLLLDSIILNIHRLQMDSLRLRSQPNSELFKTNLTRLNVLRDSTLLLAMEKTADSVELSLARQSIDRAKPRIFLLAGGNPLVQIDVFDYKIDLINAAFFYKKDSVFQTSILKYEAQDTNRIQLIGKRLYSLPEKLNFVASNIFSPIKLFGLVITALMLSLGAPFWFDLLKKLVAIRGAGIKPEEKKQNITTDSNTSEILLKEENKIQQPARSPEQTFLEIKQALLKIDGVIVVMDNKTKPGRNINIYVKFDINEQFIKKAISEISGTVEITYSIIVKKVYPTQVADPTDEPPRFGIANKSKLFGYGALGLLVKNTDTSQKAFISCWHVLKGDRSFDKSHSDNTEIIDFNSGEKIGNRWGGGIDDKVDMAVADMNSNKIYADNKFLKMGSNLSLGNISPDDVDNNLAVKFFDNKKGVQQTGVLRNSGCSAKIWCLDGMYRNFHDLLIVTQSASANVAISSGGNSGSVLVHSGKVLAMIIADCDEFTYAIEINKIFNHFDQLQII